MTGCLDCQRAGRTSSTAYHNVLDECRKIRGDTCNGCQKLLQIERQIEDARRTLDNLLDERHQMTNYLNACHDNCIRLLPVELTSQIFLHSLPYKASSDIFNVGSGFEEKKHVKAVLNLGRVSRYWRNVAQSTPALWNIFSTNISPNNPVASSIDLTRQWLERSAGLFLFVRLYTSEESEGDVSNSSCVREVVSSALIHAQRWKVLSIDLPPTWMNWISESLSDRHLPKLEHLLFETNGFTEGDVLHLNASPLQFTMHMAWLSQVSVDWSQLAHFSGIHASLTMDECIQIFRAAPRYHPASWSVLKIYSNPAHLSFTLQYAVSALSSPAIPSGSTFHSHRSRLSTSQIPDMQTRMMGVGHMYNPFYAALNASSWSLPLPTMKTSGATW